MPSTPKRLSDLTPLNRANFLWQVFRECEEFKAEKEERIIEIFRFIRNLPDRDSPYHSDFRHPYAYAVAESIKSAVYPILFSADPSVELVDPNPQNHARNQIAEQILTSFVRNPGRTNLALAMDRILDDVIWFGFSAPWTYFKSESRNVGPRFEPQSDPITGQPILGRDGQPVMEGKFRPMRVYHAPWIEHVDAWDTFWHPDGLRGFTRRDATGYELLEQSAGANPIYDFDLVMEMIQREGQSSKRAHSHNYTDGNHSARDRDEMSKEAGAEPGRHDAMLRSVWAQDILAKPFVLLHYDDGRYSGTYAVASGKGSLMELRFNEGVSYDGTSQRMRLTYSISPQDLYGTGLEEIAMPLTRLHTRFFQAASDITALTQNPMWLVSPQFKEHNPRLITGPGALIETPPLGRGGFDEHIKRLDMPQGAFQPMQFVDTIQRGLDMLFAQDDFSRGNFSGGRKTARESMLVANAAQNRIQVLYDRIVNQFAIPLMRKWLAMSAEHYTQRDYVEMLGLPGVEYVPPSTREIVSGLTYIPKGSINGADLEMRRQSWPAALQTLMQTLPVMQVPHIHESVKRYLSDLGHEAVSKMIPSVTDPRMTEFQATIQQALQQQQQLGAQPGAASPPRSPGDISGLLRSRGGASAPPGPQGGNGNAAQVQIG